MNWLLLLLTFEALASQGQILRSSGQAMVDTAQLGAAARLGQHVQLPALSTLPDQRHVRFFTAGNVVDCWQSQAGVYQGQVVQWVREVAPGKEPATNREFVLTQLLANSTVQALFAVLDSSQILSVPDERAIRGWKRNFLAGVSYRLEYRDAHTHRVATYGNPAAQGSLPEAQFVVHFMHCLYGRSHMRELQQLFVGAIPYEGFTDRSGLITLRVRSYAQQTTYRRDRQRYRRHQAQRDIHALVKP